MENAVHKIRVVEAGKSRMNSVKRVVAVINADKLLAVF